MRSSLLSAGLLFLATLVPASAAEDAGVLLASGDAAKHPQQPQVAVDSAGGIHVAWGLGDGIWYSHSEDGGKTFSEPVATPSAGVLSLGMRRGPRIVATKNAVCITAVGGVQGKGRDGDLIAFSTTDAGANWTTELVNDAAGSAREGLHATASDGRGRIAAVWLDLRNRRTEVAASISADDGKTWSKNLVVYRSPEKNVCECCHPSVTFDDQGRIIVMWRNSLGGNRDMYAAVSSDDGRMFEAATKLGTGTWPLKGCPMDGGAVAALSAGSFATVWRRETTIFLTVDDHASERKIGVGEQPWIAGTAAGPHVVWLKARGAELLYLPPSGRHAQTLAAQAKDPVIASGPQGAGPLVVAWESRDADRFGIRCRVISAK